MTDLPGAIFLGLIQGITEWLPVSSSGHLVLAQQFLNIEAGVAFDLMLHLSTLFVVLLLFRKDVLSILKAFSRRDFTSEGRLGLLIILATIFSGLTAFLFEGYINFLFTSTLAVGAGLLVTGCVLFASRYKIFPQSALEKKRSIFVGVVQGIAAVPGISRSGSTVSAALMAGLDKKTAVRFSLLMSIPAIAGAVVYALKDAPVLAMEPFSLAAGMAVSFVVGWFSLKALIKTIMSDKFWMFAVYCWAMGVLVIIFSL